MPPGLRAAFPVGLSILNRIITIINIFVKKCKTFRVLRLIQPSYAVIVHVSPANALL